MSAGSVSITFIPPTPVVGETAILFSTLGSEVSKAATSTVSTLSSSAATSTSSEAPVHEDPHRPARVAAAAVAIVVVTVVLLYIFVLLALYEHNVANPKPKRDPILRRIRHYLPYFYTFLVLTSLIEGALSAWLLVQFHFFRGLPNIELRAGVRLVVFNSWWTILTSIAMMVLSLHSRWAHLPIASVGVHILWLLVTWAFWVAGAGTIDSAFPDLVTARCKAVPQCSHLQAVYSIAVILIVTIVSTICFCVWYAWHRIRANTVERS